MKLSIILATCNRADIIVGTLESIKSIRLKDHELELIVIDQSFDDKTYLALEEYFPYINILYFHALRRGLSHSRNLGLDFARGDYVCFGDDDCAYSHDLLDSLNKYVLDNQSDIIGGGVYIPFTSKLTRYTYYDKPCMIKMRNMAKLITSISIFVRRNIISDNGFKFDDKFGLGAEFSSCEELDFVYRILDSGFKGIYRPDVVVYHEDTVGYTPDKTFSYAKGHGAYCRKLLSSGHLGSYIYVATKFFKTLLKFPVGFVLRRQFHAKSFFKGFSYGFKNYKKHLGG
ncbi:MULTISPECIES: glycosyltransferase family 2 protein [Gammaproteobacteria]|uniref:glycosyltransferase family 2 protein n=1 Tax=Gammaproteobacteria TaxID=1236 RepID=UPI003A8F24F7